MFILLLRSFSSSHQDRLQAAVAGATSEDGLHIDDVLRKLTDSEQAESALKVDEIESRAFEFYSHVSSVKRVEADEDYDSGDDEEVDSHKVTLQDIATTQRNDRMSSYLINYIKSNGKALPCDELEIMWMLRLVPHYLLSAEGILVKLKPDVTLGDAKLPCRPAIHVPPGLRSKVIRLAHEEKGHAGSKRTYRAIKDRFDWAGMQSDIARYLSTCGPCQRNAAATSTESNDSWTLDSGPMWSKGVHGCATFETCGCQGHRIHADGCWCVFEVCHWSAIG